MQLAIRSGREVHSVRVISWGLARCTGMENTQRPWQLNVCVVCPAESSALRELHLCKHATNTLVVKRARIQNALMTLNSYLTNQVNEQPHHLAIVRGC